MSAPGLLATRRVGLIAFEGVNGIDLAGPLEVFATATALDPTRPGYTVEVVAAAPDPIRTEAGLLILPDRLFADAPDYDTIVVPGGATLREGDVAPAVVDWLTTRLGRTRRLASVCTGFYGLAATGALDGRSATTHWRFVSDAQRRFPAVRLQADCIYIEDGPCFTSGGVCAGIDLALALVRDDLGPSAALEIGREMVVHSMRAGPQPQFSEASRVQARAPRRLADLVAWIVANLGADLSLPVLAARAAIGERQLSRMFRDGLGETPGALVARLRLEAARDLLSAGRVPVSEVARLAGYRSADAFGRAYVRAHGEPPGVTRDRLSRTMSETAG
ncbi:GlxA family transcriptional regulator [Sphingomonas oligophenolica]|uniref:Helix-turn-helix domain-containing protein n=1 Tax=Sphingomonas oligophenolica TaxID=301154 RepID=A0ABU9Y2I5_9SPHN